MDTQSNFFQSKHIRLLSIGLAGLVGVALIYGFFGYNNYIQQKEMDSLNNQQKEMGILIMEIKENMTNGNYKNALKNYDELIPKTLNESNRQYLILEREKVRFFYNAEPFDRSEAVRAVSAIVADTALNPRLRALAVDALLDFNRSDYTLATLGQILAQEPFSSKSLFINTKDDTPLLLRYMAEFGNALYPLAELRVAEGYWYAMAILGSQGSVSPEKINEYKKILEQIISNASSLEVSEKATQAKITRMSFLNALGFLQGVAQVGATNQSNIFEITFAEALVLANSDKNNRLLQEGALYTRLYYAGALRRLYGSARKEDIKKLLATLVVEYKSINEPEKLSFYSFITYPNSNSAKKDSPLKQSFITLAGISPEFKELLIQNGWAL